MNISTLPKNIPVFAECSLVAATSHFADEMHALVRQNRERLSQALHWPRFVNTHEDTANFLRNCEVNFHRQKDAVYVVLVKDIVAGVVSCQELDLANETGYIGYWLGVSFEGAGIVSRAVDALIRAYADANILHRFVIKASIENIKSQAVAERLQFIREGTLMRGERIGDRFHDQYLYAKVV